MKYIYPFLFILLYTQTNGQSLKDTIKSFQLTPIEIGEWNTQPDITRLPEIQGTFIFDAKKNEVIQLSKIDANIAEKVGREVFARIPGVFVYDMDGSGNQINVSTRGLDPHRGWEFNVRKDGIITNSDLFGYPASHYSMPLESVERIELVRGTGSLQYGSQFGGMLNYISKKPDTTRAFGFETMQTAGTYGLFSSYYSIGGKVDKLTYSAYYARRTSNGYRNNGDSKYNAQQVTLSYEVNDHLTLKAEWSRSSYIYHIPGPLTEAKFKADPRQSSRSRNYFNPDINVPSISLDWRINDHTRFTWVSSAVLGTRNSVMFDKASTIEDTINLATGQYNNRQVDVDNFNSFYNEGRLLYQYKLFNQVSSLSAGVGYMNTDLHRQQLGVGTTGSNFDLSLVKGFQRDLHLKSQLISLFVENNFRLTSKLSLNLGVRYEIGKSDMSGVITAFDYPVDQIPHHMDHTFPLFGANLQYRLPGNQNLYAGASQAFRPVTFKDIVPASYYERSPRDIKDARGYNLEAGYRGSRRNLKWDLSAFHLFYQNRLGILTEEVIENGTPVYYTLRTNIGDSRTTGVEAYIGADFKLTKLLYLSVFTSTAYMDAHYVNAFVKNGNDNVDVSGNKVESAPEWISRNGITLGLGRIKLSGLVSYVAESYADALNTVTPNATASVGLVPAYTLLDLHLSVKVSHKIEIKFNANNVTDKQYFTKRPQFYPGGAIWPSDGRTFSCSVGLSL